MQLIGTNAAWNLQRVTADVYAKNGTWIAENSHGSYPNRYICHSLVFSDTAPKPDTGKWSGISQIPEGYDVNWYLSLVGNTADGIPVWAWSTAYGSTECVEPEKWADDYVPQGMTISSWVSRYTKKDIEQIRDQFSVDFKLYRYNDIFEIRWKGNPKSFGYEEGKSFNGTNTSIELDAQERVNTTRFNWTTCDYDDLSYKFLYYELMEVCDVPSNFLEELLGKGMEKFGFDNPSLYCYVYIRAKTSRGDHTTNWVRFKIYANGDAEAEQSGSGTGGTWGIEPEGTTPEGADDTPTSKNDTSNITNEGDPAITGASVLTTSYALTPAQVKTFGNFLWDDNFLDNVALLTLSPSENVVSCKLFPCSFTGTDSALKVGNVIVPLGAGVFAKKLEGTNKANNVIQYGWKKVAPEGATPTFIDYSGSVLCYLPFIGYKELPLEICMNKFLRIQYNIDIVSGECQVTLYTSSSNSADLTTNYGTPFVKYSGSIAVDIPLTSSNRSNIESAMLQNVMGAGASAVMGNAGGVLSNAGGFVNNALFGQVHYETKGVPTPSCELLDKFIPFLVYIRPHYQNTDNFRSNYGHSIGYKCNNVYTIGTLKGFTKVYDFDTDGIKGTEEEKQELKRIMESGFIA